MLAWSEALVAGSAGEASGCAGRWGGDPGISRRRRRLSWLREQHDGHIWVLPACSPTTLGSMPAMIIVQKMKMLTITRLTYYFRSWP